MTNERDRGSNPVFDENLLPDSMMREIFDNASWEQKVALESTSAATIVFGRMGNRTMPPFPDAPSDPVSRILLSMYELDRKEFQQWKTTGETPQVVLGFIAERNLLYQQIAREIKKNQKYYFFEEMINRVVGNSPSDVRDLLTFDIATAHLLVGKEDRLLVGLKGGVFWKKIEWPSQPNDFTPHIRTSSFYLAMAPQIGRREMEIVPEKPLIPEDLEQMRIPKPSQSVEDALEQAYYGQRYIVPYEGAEVRFRKAGDLDKVVLLQTRNMLFGKIVTEKGEALTAIDLENAGVLSDLKEKPFGGILAEVYRDMVTAVELHANRSRRLKNLDPVLIEGDDVVEPPQVIYIPRTVRIGDKEEFRPAYTGPARPTTPHRVTGHRRHVNMSEQHRQELLRFEEETGISILENLPAGYTFVRPHVVPSDANLVGLPVFIKKRIETKLREDLQHAVDEIKQEPDSDDDLLKTEEITLHEGQEAEIQGRRFLFGLPRFRRN